MTKHVRVQLLGPVAAWIDDEEVTLNPRTDKGREILIALAFNTDRVGTVVELKAGRETLRSRHLGKPKLPVRFHKKGRAAEWGVDPRVDADVDVHVHVDARDWRNDVSVVLQQRYPLSTKVADLLGQAREHLGGIKLTDDSASKAARDAQEEFCRLRGELVELALTIGAKEPNTRLVEDALRVLGWQNPKRAEHLRQVHASRHRSLLEHLDKKYSECRPREASFNTPVPKRYGRPVVGRSSTLRDLTDDVDKARKATPAPVCTVHGEPGIGKSHVAAHLIKAPRGGSTVNVAWVYGDDIAQGIEAIAFEMGWKPSDHGRTALEAFKDMLPYFGTWIIVVDGCLDRRSLRPYSDGTSGGLWLVTGREPPSRRLARGYQHQLEPLSHEEARELLADHGISSDEIDEVIAALGDVGRELPRLPRALVMIADWLVYDDGNPRGAPAELEDLERIEGQDLVKPLTVSPLWVRRLAQRLGQLGGVAVPDRLLTACLAFEEEATKREARGEFRRTLGWSLEHLGLPEAARAALRRSGDRAELSDRYVEAGRALCNAVQALYEELERLYEELERLYEELEDLNEELEALEPERPRSSNQELALVVEEELALDVEEELALVKDELELVVKKELALVKEELVVEEGLALDVAKKLALVKKKVALVKKKVALVKEELVVEEELALVTKHARVWVGAGIEGRDGVFAGVASSAGDIAEELSERLRGTCRPVERDAAWLAWDRDPKSHARLLAYAELELREDERLDFRITPAMLAKPGGEAPERVVAVLRQLGERELADQAAGALPPGHWLATALAQDRGEAPPPPSEVDRAVAARHEAAAQRNAGDLDRAEALAKSAYERSRDPDTKARSGLLLARICLDRGDLSGSLEWTKRVSQCDQAPQFGPAILDHIYAQQAEVLLEEWTMHRDLSSSTLTTDTVRSALHTINFRRRHATVSAAFDVLIAARVAAATRNSPCESKSDDILHAAESAVRRIAQGRTGSLSHAIAARHLMQLRLDLSEDRPVPVVEPPEGIPPNHREHAWWRLIAGELARREGDRTQARKYLNAAMGRFERARGKPGGPHKEYSERRRDALD